MEKDQRPPGGTDHAPPRDARPGEGKHVTQFSVATTECAGNGKERPEYQFSVATNEYIGQGKEKAEYRMIAMPSATKGLWLNYLDDLLGAGDSSEP